MSNMLKVEDTLNSNEGKGYITINGKTREFFELQKIDAVIELIVSERKILGNRMVQNKVTGAKGTGSVTMHFNNADMLKAVQEYLKTGKVPVISIQVYNYDSASSVGRQEIILKDVIISKIQAIKLDGDSEDGLTAESDFTFGRMDGLEYFKDIN